MVAGRGVPAARVLPRERAVGSLARMISAAALVVLAAHAVPAEAPLPALQSLATGALAVPAALRPLRLVAPSGASLLGAGAVPLASGGGAPACLGDVCQPRVSVPGYDPRYDFKGRRTDLALDYVRKLGPGPIAAVAAAVARIGVRVAFDPTRFEPGHAPLAHAGWGRFEVLVRWRLDALNAPVFGAGS